MKICTVHADSEKSATKNHCNDCAAMYMREYYRSSPKFREGQIENAVAWQEENKEAWREIRRQYYQKNRERVLANQKKYKQKHKKRIQEYNKQYYQANKEKLVARTRKWNEENKEYRQKYQEKYQKKYWALQKEKLTDRYVKNSLGNPSKVSKKTIEMKREMLKLKMKLKKVMGKGKEAK